MELLKCNQAGKIKFVELTNEGYDVVRVNDLFFLEKENEIAIELSTNFANFLLSKGIISQM